jgi:hypothetical protein
MRVAVDVPMLLRQLEIEADDRDGEELWAACPLPAHAEEKASWSIRNDPGADRNGVWHCFGCQESGNAAQLVMHLVQPKDVLTGEVNYGAAVDWLLAHGHAPDQGRAMVGVRCVVIGLARPPGTLLMPYGVDFPRLEDWATPPRRYLQGRGVPGWQVQRWGIGYAAVGELAGRIVFPLRARGGRLLNYHARAFDGNERRYMYPSTEDGPDLDAVFGEEHWEPGYEENRMLVVCEGVLDALAVERATWAGPISIAAIGGSALRPGQLGKLARFGTILVATDNDRAGNHAAIELRNALGSTRKLKRVIFPERMDAASMTRSELQEVLRDARG